MFSFSPLSVLLTHFWHGKLKIFSPGLLQVFPVLERKKFYYQDWLGAFFFSLFCRLFLLLFCFFHPTHRQLFSMFIKLYNVILHQIYRAYTHTRDIWLLVQLHYQGSAHLHKVLRKVLECYWIYIKKSWKPGNLFS